jgi:hypothetical protein
VTDDVQGRRFPSGTSGSQRESDDTAGHTSNYRFGDAERDEDDDVEGHARARADGEWDEADDTDGHLGKWGYADGDEDDVAGHGLGPLDPKRA